MTKILTGKVVSCGKIPKTVTVEVEVRRPHPLYKKIIKKSRRHLAHLEGSPRGFTPRGLEVKEGDLVKISQVRPISKRKHFKVLEVLR